MTGRPTRSDPAIAPGHRGSPAPPAQPRPVDEIAGHTGDPDFMTSLARGLAVMRAFSSQRRLETIARLSQRTGIPRAAVRRCLHTLTKLGFVAADEDGHGFALRPKVLTLGFAYLSSSPLAGLAQPLLDRVSDRVHESCSMAALDGDDIVYLARSRNTRRIMSVDLGVGSRLPAHCTSLGRVLLAGLPAEARDAYLRRVEPTPQTPRTVTSTTELAAIIDTVGRRGYAVVDQELEIGLRSIAVPVRDQSGRVVAAMNVGTQVSRFSVAEMESRLLPALREAAEELGLLLAP